MTRIVHFLTFLFTKLIFNIFLNFEVYGKENLKLIRNNAIFVSNHESYFDPFLISSGISLFSHFHPIHYIAEESLFESFWGKLSKLGAPIPGNIKNGIGYALRKPLNLLYDNNSIGVFYEWCYKNQPLLDRVNKLIVTLSHESQKPIIPVYIFGAGNLTWKKIFTRQDKVLILYGKPFFIDHKLSDSDKVQQLHNEIKKTQLQLFDIIDNKEKKFWSNYGKLYHHIESVKPYKDLVDILTKRISPKGLWLDIGSGSGGIVDVIKNKTTERECKIVATDFDPGFLSQLKKRFLNDPNIEIRELDLSKKIPFENNTFNGVTANLVIPYIIHYENNVGIKALKMILEDIFAILKPGGEFRWSSPKKNVKFWKVFVASREKIFGFDNKEQLFYGPALLKQALVIQDKGKKNIYHFLNLKDLSNILNDIGFVEISFHKAMAKQVDVIICKKPL